MGKARSRETRRPGKPALLFVDDDEDFLASISEFIKGEEPGWTVITAATASEGLSAITRTKFDIIFSDYRMPDMDGVAFLHEALLRQPTSKRVLFTGHPDATALAQGGASPSATLVLVKPLATGPFLSRLRQLLWTADGD